MLAHNGTDVSNDQLSIEWAGNHSASTILLLSKNSDIVMTVKFDIYTLEVISLYYVVVYN